MEFSIEPTQPQIDPLNVNKNLKELKVGSGEKFFVDSKGNMTATSGTFSGKIEIKDELGNVVILLDPNG